MLKANNSLLKYIRLCLLSNIHMIRFWLWLIYTYAYKKKQKTKILDFLIFGY